MAKSLNILLDDLDPMSRQDLYLKQDESPAHNYGEMYQFLMAIFNKQ